MRVTHQSRFLRRARDLTVARSGCHWRSWLCGRVLGVAVRDERGASAVIVAICLPVLVAMGAMAVDAGALWTARRVMVTATDAAALAAARAYALGEDGCAQARVLLERNSPGASMTSCTRVGSSVSVSGTSALVPVRFARVMGIGDQPVVSTSAAGWHTLSGARGLRPIGICVANPHVQWWLGLGPDVGPHPEPGVNRVPYPKEQPQACGSRAPGNWGFIDFDGGSNADTDLRRWLETGFDRLVAVGDCDARPPAGDPCEGDTGSSGGSIAPDLQSLVDSGEEFGIVIFDEVAGSGANVRYRVHSFLGVVLHGFRVTGPELGRYFDFRFTRIVLEGDCCATAGPDTGARGIRICGSETVACIPTP